MSAALRAALAAGSGLAYGAAFPPWDLAALSWVALAPLFAACAAARPRAAAGLGLLWALAAGAAAAPFLPGMLAGYFRVDPAFRVPAALGLLLLSAGPHGALLGAFVSAAARRRRARPIALAAGFVGFEYARSRFGLENSWALLADAQLDLGPLAQAADLAGPWGLGLLVAWGNALLAAAATARLRGPRAPREAGAFAAALLLALGYGATRGAAPAAAPPLEVALVQGGVARHWDDPAEPTASREALERYLALTERAAAGADLVVWPEGALDFAPGLLTRRWVRLRRWSRGLGAPLLFGAPRPAEDPAAPARAFNSAFLLQGGSLRLAQDKVKLVPFAERALLGVGARGLHPGAEAAPLEAAGAHIGVVLCSEIMSSSYVRRVVRGGATLLVNASNDHWFASEAGARGQLAKARMRAIETRRPVLRATSTGYSALIDARGAVLARGPWGGEAVVQGAIAPSAGHSPYLVGGDLVAWLALAAAGLALRAPRGETPPTRRATRRGKEATDA